MRAALVRELVDTPLQLMRRQISVGESVHSSELGTAVQSIAKLDLDWLLIAAVNTLDRAAERKQEHPMDYVEALALYRVVAHLQSKAV